MKINKCLLALGALGIVGGAAGCGETSYFEVTVMVASNVPGVDLNCIYKIDSCEVRVTGGGGELFQLRNGVCRTPESFNLGLFQYATEKESGNVAFQIKILDGNVAEVGQGMSAPTPIKAGGRQPVTVTIAPDAAALRCNQP